METAERANHLAETWRKDWRLHVRAIFFFFVFEG